MKKLLEIDTLKLLPATYKELKTWNKINEIVRAHNELLNSGMIKGETWAVLVGENRSVRVFGSKEDVDWASKVLESAELLETHTAKEPCGHKKSTLSKSTKHGTRKICNNCGQDWKNEWDVTPPSNSEKEECCDICEDLCFRAVKHGVKFGTACPCHQEEVKEENQDWQSKREDYLNGMPLENQEEVKEEKLAMCPPCMNGHHSSNISFSGPAYSGTWVCFCQCHKTKEEPKKELLCGNYLPEHKHDKLCYFTEPPREPVKKPSDRIEEIYENNMYFIEDALNPLRGRLKAVIQYLNEIHSKGKL